jgi:hypothetical protein
VKFKDTDGKLRLATMQKMMEAEEGYEIAKAGISRIKTQMANSIPGLGAWTHLELKLKECRETEDLYRQEVIMYATMLTAYATLAK